MTRIEELEKQITELDERKVALQEELEFEKQKQFEYPFEYNKSYWLLDSKGEILHSCWYQDSIDTARCEIGNAFFTVEATQKERDKRILLTRFRQFRDKCNGDWKPQLRELKYYIFLNCTDFNCSVSYDTVCNAFNLFGYFKHKTDCKRAIELFGDEIKRLYVEE
nr:MAG TPA: hypothetical protein [Caudoviricetes sp.]